MLIAEKYHPAWNKCTPGARKLHARNSFQVLGSTLDSPAEYDGGPTGGTGQAIRIATALKIPVLNLYLDWAIDEAFAII